MGRNAYWFQQQRARGVCYICRRPMDDADPRQAHRDCYRLQSQGKTSQQIRRIVGATLPPSDLDSRARHR
jgi:hypothetical protein